MEEAMGMVHLDMMVKSKKMDHEEVMMDVK